MMELGDRVFYIGNDESVVPTGSSGKLRAMTDSEVEVNWGGNHVTLLPRADIVDYAKFERLGKPGW